MMTTDFYSLLRQVTVDSKDDGRQWLVTDRLEAIDRLLRTTDYRLLKGGKLFRLYGKMPEEGGDVVLLSSHIDCVYTRCFCEEEGEFYRGTFDNSLTNAAVVENMLAGTLPDNVVVAFTGDEEKDSGGALELISWMTTRGVWNVRFALVTDVTNEGWDVRAPFSIENDLGIDLFTAHEIVEALDPYLYSYVHAAEPDESWDYDSVHWPTLTLCAPVLGDMHSDGGTLARRDAMPVYSEVLALLAGRLALMAQPALAPQ